MVRPVIGLTSYLEPAIWGDWESKAVLIHDWYVDVLHEAGAEVVILPPENSPTVVDRCDGLALAGGADVSPLLYGAEVDPTTDVPRISRDESELSLYRRARELGMPVLGICRGVQLMAVAHGGSLIQHLPALTDVKHREGTEHFVDHQASFAEGSHTARLLGVGPLIVNSSNHQAVDSPGDLTITGWSQDGTVEVCEDTSAEFCIGVQWHPEHPERRLVDAPLIRAFVESALRYSGIADG
ncbi:MAG: gamma-glutamyl-gamma-aminobutyrate hydrolase family protein [Actinomycetota bacterium]|nr:gamma-glutamyl-gamma-aminobutyrate hydrolase family protein [Actinomycetota bacterium]